MSGFVVKNHNLAPKSFRYRINFVYIIGFGETFSPFSFIDEFERVLVYYFGMKAEDAPKQEIDSAADIGNPSDATLE